MEFNFVDRAKQEEQRRKQGNLLIAGSSQAQKGNALRQNPLMREPNKL